VLAEQGIASRPDTLLKTLLEREAIGTTGVGFGIAIPHVRSMVVESTAIIFARLPKGLDFAAPDGEPVRVVYLIVAPYGVTGALYLPLLAVLAAASRQKSARRTLLAVETFEDFADLMSRVVRPRLLEVLER
jgi:mannitol/fructose-specific phosphotransferase system IIA component (Ntr-type)